MILIKLLVVSYFSNEKNPLHFYLNASFFSSTLDCGPLSNPDFGTVNIASGTTYGKKANYFCNFGYTLNGVSQRLCAEDGLWSHTEPVCEINGWYLGNV